PHLHKPAQAHLIEADPGRLHDQVVGDLHIRLQCDVSTAPGCEGQIEPVGKRDRLEHSAQLVITIGPLVQDSQIEIDLGQCADASPPCGVHHLSYCISENTS